ncbi:MAG: hypothetical protein KME31_08460 [Tolypothrix carrinoi HA7290-LM1]|jgi:hypothetical protein|nr:hypothetical protein [Tolypothrix carrinoi HA7290-LM1]
MVAITPGSNASFKSATAEGLLLEVITYLQNQERNTISNPTNRDLIKLSYNLDSLTAIGSFSIPATQSINDAGQIILVGTDYLQNVPFSPGDGGTFKSTSLSQYFLEIVAFLQIKESDVLKNPNSENNVFSAYDADDKISSGTINLPLTVSFDDSGHPVISAKEYLL